MNLANLSGLAALFKTIPGYRDLVRELRAPPHGKPANAPVRALGLLEAARPALIASLQRDLAAPLLVITSTPERSRHLWEQVQAFAKVRERVLLFPAPDALPFERVPWDAQTIRQRLQTLTAISQLQSPISTLPPVVVTDVRALLYRTLPPGEFAAAVRVLRRGDRLNMSQLLKELIGLGYQATSVVEAPGELSHRGGIIDIFPLSETLPARVELFGDEIESIRRFDPESQLSADLIEAIVVGPAREALPRAGPSILSLLEQLNIDSLHPLAEGDFRRHREALAAATPFAALEFYLPLLHPQPATLLSYLPAETRVLVEDWREVRSAGIETVSQSESLRAAQVRAGELPHDWPGDPMVRWEELEEDLFHWPLISIGYDGRPESHPVSLAFHAAPHFGGQLEEAVLHCLAQIEKGETVVLVSRQARRLADLFEEAGHPIVPVSSLTEPPAPGGLTLVEGILAEGWRLEAGWELAGRGQAPFQPPTSHLPSPISHLPSPISLLTDGELFGWRMPKRRQAPKRQAVSPESFFADLAPGDYVVHIEHGIARFAGLTTLEMGGVKREYLELEYAHGDRLYVPTYQVDRVSRYVGVGDRPPVSRLGSTDWERVKARAKRAVADIARELLALYAARETVPGHAYSPDTTWQAELEASFPYEETEDQARAIDEVKADMEQPRPMDRLIAGDVGYGKTEVALRAAFKAVMDGKQVAVLVPTTVLAQQHFGTFCQRLATFPVEVEMLSRFRSKAEQQDVLERLARGQVDIVIGTHRLLQKDVRFKDLGLLIVDEEQRFGVEHKERLKQIRKEVDVLTLTATPIPRTLHMSLTGVRDMSTIDTPPQARLPVVTYVGEFDDDLVRQAILRELSRNGQVYFVHNRVQGIQLMAQKVRRLVPEAVVAVAHGQMDEGELARVMLDFAAGRVDVLVCTSIIESGLDIPNANTLIVNRADQFGLAQLYQLRGRVGRSHVRAYAYLLYDRHSDLNPDARRRLQAIREASELGSGFRIAMRDLEIRGAGEILGARQHGHIAAIGFDLYCRLLAQAIKELQADSPEAQVLARPQPPSLEDEAGQVANPTLEPGLAPAIELPVAAFLPQEYVPEPGLRLRLYRRMANLTTVEEVKTMAQELEDRFGPLPEPARNLIFVLDIRALAIRAGVQSITHAGDAIELKLPQVTGDARQRLQERLGKWGWVGRTGVWLPVRGADESWREDLRTVLELIGDVRGDG